MTPYKVAIYKEYLRPNQKMEVFNRGVIYKRKVVVNSLKPPFLGTNFQIFLHY